VIECNICVIVRHHYVSDNIHVSNLKRQLYESKAPSWFFLFKQIAIQIFGEMLYRPGTDCLTEFPSPASLKNMVLISTKSPKEYNKSSGSYQVLNGCESPEDESRELQDSMVKPKTEEKVSESYIPSFHYSKRKTKCEFFVLALWHSYRYYTIHVNVM